MRRLARLKRPAGLHVHAHPQSSSSALPFLASSPQRPAPVLATTSQQPRPTAAAARPTAFSRFYSSDKPPQEPEKQELPQQEQELQQEQQQPIEPEVVDQQALPPQGDSPKPDEPAELPSLDALLAENKADGALDPYDQLNAAADADADAASSLMTGYPPAAHFALPPEPTEAERAGEVTDVSYAPAVTGEGLERVGDELGRWWDSRDHWSPAADFAGFRPAGGAAGRVAHPAVLEASVRAAVVEALALRRAGRDDRLVGRAWPVQEADAFAALMLVDLRVVDGVAVLGVGGDAGGEGGEVVSSPDSSDSAAAPVDGIAVIAETMLREMEQEEGLSQGQEAEEGWDASEAAEGVPSSQSVALDPEVAVEFMQTWDPSWKNISLADPRMKFAVTKRVFQMTGHLVPDHKLPAIRDVRSLLAVVQKPPKPKTLTETIHQQHQQQQQPQREKYNKNKNAAALLTLPNVTVAAKRVTRADRERALGRLKLMHEEMRKRDLPLHGHGFAEKNKEMSRFRGGV
ncbi:ribosomal subunit 39S-domain-containing protein [Xylariaceae sp. FL0804]|nr:ribosomal subunit 39S-domain-containing protein [Xylariaceae sp. FL0804]